MGILESLSLSNFRNYERLSIDFSPGLNLIIGSNGQGKTNFLEAVYYLSVLRSFRTNQIRHLIRWDCSQFRINGRIGGCGPVIQPGVCFGDQRRLFINNKSFSRASEYIGRLICVAFVPEDIDLAKGPAGGRRKFLDLTLSQLNPLYLTSLQDYHRALKSRNALLRKWPIDRQAIAAFDHIIVRSGAPVCSYRAQFCRDLNRHVNSLTPGLFNQKDRLEVEYLTSTTHNRELSDDDEFKSALTHAIAAGLDRDIHYRTTQVGPHRDDFLIRFNDRNIQNFGSEGQSRLAALTIKMATARFVMDQNSGKTIIFLADDVMGELDPERRQSVVATLKDGVQVFLAYTDQSIAAECSPSAVFEVDRGVMRRIE